MRNILLALLISCYIFSFAQSEIERDKIMPSMTLPVLYINTIENTPIDQREVYIEAKAWIDASMTDEFESIGSSDDPLILGIRGRGNGSWYFDKKPYKIKFQKNVSLLGLKASKHWALLHWLGSTTSYFREPLGYEIGRRLGEAWIPSVTAVEVVLNNQYIGIYFLSETVRVEKNRVNIPKQPDYAEEDEIIKSGWLVEIDNYNEENQSHFIEPKGIELKLTYKSPKFLSEKQKYYIEEEFTNILSLLHGYKNGDWLDVIDGESIARYYIINEVLQNKDGFNGSFYWHKSNDSKWIAGPLWDLGYSLEQPANDSYLNTLPSTSCPKLIRKMLSYPKFREIVKDLWNPFYLDGTQWIDEIVNEWTQKIGTASLQDSKIWSVGQKDIYNRGLMASSILKSNIEWFNSYVNSDQFYEWEQPSILDNVQIYDLMGRKVIPYKKGIYVYKGHKFVWNK